MRRADTDKKLKDLNNNISEVDKQTGLKIPVGVSPEDWEAAYSFSTVEGLLSQVGVPELVVPWAAAQTALETGNYKSKVSLQDHNLSGINFINKPIQRNASRGRPKPKNEGKGFYAHFPTFLDWAKDYKRILSLGEDQAPIKAKTLSEFVSRLKAHKYFTSDAGQYYKNLYALGNRLSKIADVQSKEAGTQLEAWHNAHDSDPIPTANKKDFFKSLPTWAKWGIGGLGLIVVARSIKN